MSGQKKEICGIIRKDFEFIHNRRVELFNRFNESLEENLFYLRDLAAQLLQPSSGPLAAKTPKLQRKKAIQRIETIPENEVFQQQILSPANSQRFNEEPHKESNKVTNDRTSQRRTSKKAIKKRNSDNSVKEAKRRTKRKKSLRSSSDEDYEETSKYSKVEENITEGTETRVTRKRSKQIIQSTIPIEIIQESEESKKDDTFKSPIPRHSNTGTSFAISKPKYSQNEEANKINDVIEHDTNEIEESSMYEDAIGKPIPIMNSTLKNNSVMSEKMLNATVVLERIPQKPILNETVVIKKASSARNSARLSNGKNIKRTLQDKASAAYDNCNELITDDESSPEIKKPKRQLNKKRENRIAEDTILMSSEDEIPNTPVKAPLKEAVVPIIALGSKAIHKSNALFSPYAKESVKKRVEAFEQVVHSPKRIDADPSMRITRTKTRAMTTAPTETETETKNAEKNITQILARKSLVKAKKISLAKGKKNDEFKENKQQLPEQINKLLLVHIDKSNVKKTQQLKMTPTNKSKLVQPVWNNTPWKTPSQNLPNQVSLSALRANIVTGVDSFIPESKTNSTGKLEEKKRYEDVRKKREETLRLQTEEKRRKRQEKELKNRLAREAKEKLELEKRQKAEREREEKAKLALIMQEKQREELEKKRLAALQRAQEKEERRKLEEQQRLQRLQEQEETERLLAEQKRREQEAEKRREAEARAQQTAAEAEKLKQKNQLAAQIKNKQQNNKHQDVVNYVLDSEPDDDDDDDDNENNPKHEIPHWALPHVRKVQLMIQQYIPQETVFKFFNTRKCTPDLTVLFHNIDKSRLKRTSSAIWKTPPRISMMETEFVEPKLRY